MPIRTRRVAALALLLALGGCVDPPIVDRLTLEFLEGGAIRATLETRIETDALDHPNRALRQRLERRIAALETGTDPWELRFEALDAESEGASWERRSGRLARVARWAVLEGEEELGLLLESAPADVRLVVAEGWSELRLAPFGGGAASRSERREVEARVAEWARTYSELLAAGWELAAAAESRPARAAALWRTAFGEIAAASEEDRRSLAPAERAPAERFSNAFDELFRIFDIEDRDGRSWEERVRSVYDPWPAEIEVVLPAAAAEVAGFERLGDGRFRAPVRSLERAARELSGRWLEPDPFAVAVELSRRDEEAALEVGPWAHRDPRRGPRPPAAEEAFEAILESLESPPELRLVWRDGAIP